MAVFLHRQRANETVQASAGRAAAEEPGTDKYVSQRNFQYRSFETFQSLSEGKPGGCKQPAGMGHKSINENVFPFTKLIQTAATVLAYPKSNLHLSQRRTSEMTLLTPG